MVQPPLASRVLRCAALAGGLLALGTSPGPALADQALPDPPGTTPAFQRVVLLQGEADPGKEKHRHKDHTGHTADLTTLSIEQLMDLEVVPINVLGGHTHPSGQWMVGYRAMFQQMRGNLVGTRQVSTGRLLRRYLDVPDEMSMEMHMLEAMYAPTDDLTLMLMLPYSRMWMDTGSLLAGSHGHGGTGSGPTRGSGTLRDPYRIETRSAGWGDLTLMSLYTFYGDHEKGRRVLFNGGISFPTGSIDRSHGGGQRHEYMMQLGSGTVDLLPGITVLGESSTWSWGAQAMGTLRLGRNDNGYRQGHRVRMNAWGSYRAADWLAPSLRLEGQVWGNISGRDPQLDPLVSPTFDPRNYGGKRIDLLLGVNLYAPSGNWKGARLSIEGGIPVYQSLSGPQLETDWTLGLSVSYTR